MNEVQIQDNKCMKKYVIEYAERWTGGGIENYILNLVKNINPEKFEIRILVSQKESEIYDKELSEYGVTVEVLSEEVEDSPIKRIIKNQKLFSHFIVNNECDVLHLHICQGVVMRYAKIAKNAGVKKVITHCHNTELGDGKRFIKMTGHLIGKQIYSSYPDIKIACSDLAAQWLYKKSDVKEKVNICPYIVDVERFKFSEKDRMDMRNKHGLGNERIYLHIGRMHYQKNQFFLLDICKKLFELDNNAKLVFIGTGELEQKIKKYALDLGIMERVLFISGTREIEKYMSMSDVFLLPSRYEGNPVVGIEAQANGLVCIFSDKITKQAKVLDISRFVPIEKCKDWVDAILESHMLKDRQTAWLQMKKTGYDIRKQIFEIESLYENVYPGIGIK